MHRAAYPAVLVVVLAGLAHAQERRLGPSPAQLVARAELARAAGGQVTVHWDAATGCPAVVRFSAPLPLEAAGPEAAAREALERVAPLFGRLAHDRQPAEPEPRLRLSAVVPFGAERHVRFEQRVGDAALEGATLVVTLGRSGERTVLRSIAGRAYRDAPGAFPAPGARPADGAQLVAAPRGGAWRLAWRTVETGPDGPVAVLTATDGEVLARRSLVLHAAGRVEGDVHPRWRTDAPARRPLRDLTVVLGDGTTATTGDDGTLPGTSMSLPAGLNGPYERVLPLSGRPYPSTTDGLLRLGFRDGDGRQVELDVFHHLVEVRRFAATIPGLPRAALTTPILVHASHQFFNAGASPEPTTHEGRTYTYQMHFGFEFGLDAAIVAHERGHVLLFALGVVDMKGDRGPLHEAYGDYLAALYTGDPELRFHGGGNRVRSISEDRVYPQHWTGLEAHEASLVFSGALWDARQAAGTDGSLVDAAAFRVVPAEVTAGVSVLDVARALLDGADERVKGPLETHLRLHGLLGEEAAAPVIEAPDEVYVREGAQETVRITAYDVAARRSGEETRVTALVDAPAFATVSPAPSASPRVEDALVLDLAPREGDVGRHLVTITAQSELTGRVAVRTIAVTVIASDRPDAAATRSERTYHLRVGEVFQVPARDLFDELARQPTEAPYRFVTSGRLSSAVQLGRDLLVATPGQDDRGSHVFFVHAEPTDTDRDRDRILTSQVTLVVGDGAAEITVKGTLDVGTRELPDQLPPGQPIVVEAGGQLELTLEGARLPGGGRIPGSAVQLGDLPASVTSRQGTSTSTILVVAPGVLDRVTTFTVQATLVDATGAELARRELVFVVIPQQRTAPDPQAQGGDAAGGDPASTPGFVGVLNGIGRN